MISKEVSGQQNYEPTAYEDAEWEMVGEYEPTSEFIPMDVEVLQTGHKKIDPMFADYGGITDTSEGKRYHVAKDSEYRDSRAQAALEDEDDTQKIALKPEEIEALKAQVAAEVTQQCEEQFNAQYKEGVEKTNVRMREIFQGLATQVKENLARIEKQSVALALEISKRIIAQAVEINPEYIVPIIQESLTQVGGATITKIRVSPQDLEFILHEKLNLVLKPGDAQWNFEPDPEITSGCIVETFSGVVDHRLEAAWERVKEKITTLVR